MNSKLIFVLALAIFCLEFFLAVDALPTGREIREIREAIDEVLADRAPEDRGNPLSNLAYILCISKCFQVCGTYKVSTVVWSVVPLLRCVLSHISTATVRMFSALITAAPWSSQSRLVRRPILLNLARRSNAMLQLSALMPFRLSGTPLLRSMVIWYHAYKTATEPVRKIRVTNGQFYLSSKSYLTHS